ncbi:condensation domain-containing protein [Streptomyces parvus]|uniref:condensation domain-containing protein n=1 Tax=Streptomyces parvus TaxID=66428 RepID=UPI0035DEAAA7
MRVQSTQWSDSAAGEMLTLVLESFGEVLDDDDIPDDVAFTVLGGSSLDGSVACALLGSALGFSVPLSLLAANPTAREFAGALALLGERSERAGLDIGQSGSGRENEGKSPEESVPLTEAQIGFLTQQLIDASDRSAHLQFAWVLTGPLDMEALRGALHDVHQRHEPLGSRYLIQRRDAVARPHTTDTVTLTCLPDAGSEQLAIDATRDALDGDLDLSAGQVWRVALARVKDRDVHVLRVMAHHIAFDGMSEAVLVKDLGAFYAVRRDGAKAALGPVAGMSERARARERHQRLNAANLDRQRAYWATELADTPPLVFPGEGPMAPATPGTLLVRRTTVLPVGWLDEVDALAARHRTTRFAVLLTLYDRVLAESSGSAVHGVGFPVARRWDGLSAGVIDCCMDTLCLRMPADTRYGVRDFADAVRATTDRLTAAFAAADVAFADIVRAVNPRRGSRAPLYQNMLALQDYDRPGLALAGTESRRLDEPYLGLPSELHVEIVPHPDGAARVAVSHRPDAVPERFAASFHTALAARLHSLPA